MLGAVSQLMAASRRKSPTWTSCRPRRLGGHALGGHLLEAAVVMCTSSLNSGCSKTPPITVCLFVDGDRVASAAKLLRCRSCRAGADGNTFFPVRFQRLRRIQPSRIRALIFFVLAS
jgi:hypothetical protein